MQFILFESFTHEECGVQFTFCLELPPSPWGPWQQSSAPRSRRRGWSDCAEPSHIGYRRKLSSPSWCASTFEPVCEGAHTGYRARRYRCRRTWAPTPKSTTLRNVKSCQSTRRTPKFQKRITQFFFGTEAKGKKNSQILRLFNLESTFVYDQTQLHTFVHLTQKIFFGYLKLERGQKWRLNFTATTVKRVLKYLGSTICV